MSNKHPYGGILVKDLLQRDGSKGIYVIVLRSKQRSQGHTFLMEGFLVRYMNGSCIRKFTVNEKIAQLFIHSSAKVIQRAWRRALVGRIRKIQAWFVSSSYWTEGATFKGYRRVLGDVPNSYKIMAGFHYMSQEIRVRFFTDYSESDHPRRMILETYGRLEKAGMVIVEDDSYTHAVVVNAAQPVLREGVPKENCVGLAWEPVELLAPPEGKFKEDLKIGVRRTFLDVGFLSWAYRHLSRYYIGRRAHLPADLFEEFHGYIHCNNWFANFSAPRPAKRYPMSLVLSQKGFLPGHRYRHRLAQLLLSTPLDIHLYGYGSEHYAPDPRARGRFQDSEPYRDYYFTVAIENTQSPHYITEKFANPLASYCAPVYLGAQRVGDYYGEGTHYKLTGDLVADFNLILDLYHNAEERYRSLDLERAQRELLEGRASIFEFLSGVFLGGKGN